MPSLRIDLTKDQHRWLGEHAEKAGREPEDDLVAVWWGRVQALEDYREKRASKSAKFGLRLPKWVPEDERKKLRKVILAKLGVKAEPGPSPKKRRWRELSEVEREKRRVEALKLAPPIQRALLKAAARKTREETAVLKGKLQRIDLYDAPGVALAKARGNAQKTGRRPIEYLEQAGRNAAGERVRK